MRFFFAKLHLFLSIPLGIIILIMSFSGSMLIFEQEIMELMYHKQYFADERADEALDLSCLLNKLQVNISSNDSIGTVLISSNPMRNIQFLITDTQSKQTRWVYMNPYNGQIEGYSSVGNQFFQTMRRLHRWLLDDFKKDAVFPIGKRLTGIAALGFVFIILSGIILWIPRKKNMIAQRLVIHRDKGLKRFIWDSHIVGGFYIAPVLLLLALTGLSWSFDWYRTGFYTLLGGDPTTVTTPVTSKLVESTTVDSIVWDRVYNELEARYDTFSVLSIQNGSAIVSLAGYGNRRRSDYYTFDSATGVLLEERLYEDESKMNQLRGWVYSIHVGSWGGILTKFIGFTAALMGMWLPFSGGYVWFMKRKKRK